MCPESLPPIHIGAVFEELVSRFLNKLTSPQRKLLGECDRSPYYSVAHKAIVIECGKTCLAKAIESQADIERSAKELKTRIEIITITDTTKERLSIKPDPLGGE